jgi:hypothetical protein
LGWVEWRASKLALRADASGITVFNLIRRHRIPWAQVRSVLAVQGDFHDFPATVRVERAKGRLWGVDVDATLGMSRSRRREVALQIAQAGRAYGYGFGAGDVGDLEALRSAGLLEESDPAAHEAWWSTHQ